MLFDTGFVPFVESKSNDYINTATEQTQYQFILNTSI